MQLLTPTGQPSPPARLSTRWTDSRENAYEGTEEFAREFTPEALQHRVALRGSRPNHGIDADAQESARG
jgi:hypothetical protein